MSNFIKQVCFKIFIIIILIVATFTYLSPSIENYCRMNNNVFDAGSSYKICLEQHGYKNMDSSFTIFTFLIFLLISIFLPDFYIPTVRNKLMDKVIGLSGAKTENEKLFYIPKILGWMERILYYLFLLFFFDQFVFFVGIWLTLKTVVTYKSWESPDSGGETPLHLARAKFIIFLIGNGLSIISVIVFFFAAKFIINK